jgi:predicted patatin/cPLA2 family phospholipase
MGGSALIVEGGGMRGIFSAGVLDAFLELGFDPFQIYIGVSAGACNLSSQVAGQYRRNFRIYTNQMVRPEFISARKFLGGGHYMDLDWLWDAFQREDPLDVVAAEKATREKAFLIVCTSVRTGRPVYLQPRADTWLDYIKASSSVPLFYRGGCHVDGEWLMDGGVADPLPVQEAIRRGAREIVVIRSRPLGYVKSPGLESRVTSFLFRRHAELGRAIRMQAQVYRSAVSLIENPPDGIAIHHIAPARPLRTRRTSQNLDDLKADYELGHELGREAVLQMRT